MSGKIAEKIVKKILQKTTQSGVQRTNQAPPTGGSNERFNAPDSRLREFLPISPGNTIKTVREGLSYAIPGLRMQHLGRQASQLLEHVKEKQELKDETTNWIERRTAKYWQERRAKLTGKERFGTSTTEDIQQKVKEATEERNKMLRRSLPGLLNPFPGMRWPPNLGDVGDVNERQDKPEDDPPGKPGSPGDIVRKLPWVPDMDVPEEPAGDEEDPPDEPTSSPDCINIRRPSDGYSYRICKKGVKSIRLRG